MKRVRILLVSSMLLLFSCVGFAQGGGKVETKIYNLSDFQNIDMSGGGKLIIRQGQAFTVAVTLDSNLFDKYEVKKNFSTLSLGWKPFSTNLHITKHIVEITLPSLESLSLSGAVEGEVLGKFSQNVFTLDLSGSSRVKASVSAKTLTIDSSGSSRVDLSGTYGTVNGDFSGASELILIGSALTIKVSSSGASSITSLECSANDVSLDLSGASRATVQALETLNIEGSGASIIKYKGNPKINKDLSGLSQVNAIN